MLTYTTRNITFLKTESAALDLMIWNILFNSANIVEYVIVEYNSAVYMKNNKGHNTEPWGIPEVTGYLLLCKTISFLWSFITFLIDGEFLNYFKWFFNFAVAFILIETFLSQIWNTFFNSNTGSPPWISHFEISHRDKFCD